VRDWNNRLRVISPKPPRALRCTILDWVDPVPIGGGVGSGDIHPFELQQFVALVTGLALAMSPQYCFTLPSLPSLVKLQSHFKSRPPQGDRRPRGFVQSTVLKVITEHPQGMTTAEIIK